MNRLIWLIASLVFYGHAQAAQVIDDSGHTLSLDSPAKRIISLAPSMTELLFAVGAGDKVVGVSEFSDYPEQASQLPIVGRYNLLDTETILSLQPDLIVAWQSGNPRAAVEQLRNLGLTVYISEPTTALSIADTLEDLAALAGTQSSGTPLANRFRERLQQLQEQNSQKETVSVFYQVWNSPLISVGGQELINDIIEICGGRNIFNDLGLAPKVSTEAVLQRAPQVIIASGMDVARPQWLDEWLAWPQMQAVANQNLYFIPPDLVQRHSPRVLQGAEQMCQHLDAARGKNTEALLK
ncbi:MAG: cobalamin-binding protein [Pseudohongiellaceae bacterium]|nr:cobalamin-binding protein [Pseudohongiellaceae bacterium]